MEKYNIYGAIAGIMVLFSACNQEELTAYGDKGSVNFMSKKQEYSFISKPAALKDTIAIPVQLSGFAADRDRTFEVEVVNDSLTTSKPDYYRILGGEVKAKEFKGNLYVEISKTGELDTMDLSLHLSLRASDDFNLGNAETSSIILTWTNEYIQFPNWSRIRVFFCLTYSREVHRRIIEVSGISDFSGYPTTISYGEMTVYGTKFGNLIRYYQGLGTPLKHDTGTGKGKVIAPIY